MQKLGLYFPGERSCCYAADAIMRQYSELKSKLKNNFSYNFMKPFFLIILMEHSSAPFKEAAPYYIHTEQISYDSGVKVNTLSRIKYISLDTFRNSVHNINNKLQAWLTFFSSDEPADILKLINADRNTIRLMIDDMQEELAAKDDEIAAKDNEIAKLKAENEKLKLSKQ